MNVNRAPQIGQFAGSGNGFHVGGVLALAIDAESSGRRGGVATLQSAQGTPVAPQPG